LVVGDPLRSVEELQLVLLEGLKPTTCVFRVEVSHVEFGNGRIPILHCSALGQGLQLDIRSARDIVVVVIILIIIQSRLIMGTLLLTLAYVQTGVPYRAAPWGGHIDSGVVEDIVPLVIETMVPLRVDFMETLLSTRVVFSSGNLRI
jgi:hypothetical protein